MAMNDLPIVNKKMKEENSFEYYLIKKVGKTIKKYGMIEKGDRIIVGVSGGKDSFTLLKILQDRKGFYPNQYEILAVHISTDLPCEGVIKPDVMEKFLKENDYPYKIINAHIKNEKGLNPFWCSWNRRRILFETANRMGFNKIALGHHRNDVIETLMLNIFYHAEISTMMPIQSLFKGKMSIIRPLYNIPESDTEKFAKMYNFPYVHCRCPFEGETKREMFKRIINEIERVHPKAGVNAIRAMENIRTEYMPGSVIKENIDI